MKFLWLAVSLLSLLVASAAVAQSNLPQCPSDPKVRWTNCQGTVTSADGSKYVGEFQNNKPDGQGTLTWSNGSKYVGEFRDGKQNGQGTLAWADGSKYVGAFTDGTMSGQGTMFARDGTITKSGIWETPPSPRGAQATDDRPVKIVVLGDSLSAGRGLLADAAFPTKLARALKAKGIAVSVANAGVSGDTASGGLGRLDRSVPEGTEAVIVELGANDALRGLDPKLTKSALDSILTKLDGRRIAVLLAGMRAPPNMRPDFVRSFDAIYPALASAHPVVFYPFFLDGVATDPKLNQRDRVHPNAAGVDAIVARILPGVEELIARARAARGS